MEKRLTRYFGHRKNDFTPFDPAGTRPPLSNYDFLALSIERSFWRPGSGKVNQRVISVGCRATPRIVIGACSAEEHRFYTTRKRTPMRAINVCFSLAAPRSGHSALA
jgi:hypothetical protein